METDRPREKRECRKSSRRGMKDRSVRKLYPLGILMCVAIERTGGHVHTHEHTRGAGGGVLAAAVSLSVLSTVSRYQVKKEKE